MRRFITSATVTLAALVGIVTVGGPAHAKYPGRNGQLVFTRYDPSTGESRIFVADPDRRRERQLPLPAAGDNPIWSPDGSEILVFLFRPDVPPRPATIHADGSGFTVLEVSALPQDMDLRCTAWSPHAARLLCQASRFRGDPALNGIYTIRASDGSDLKRLTVNPYPPSGNFGGGDIPGDFSPDGHRFVFMRAKPGPEPTPDTGQSGALFVENTDGTGLRQITPYGLANSHDNGLAHWSPDGSKILFAGEHGALFTIRPDGTGLRKIPLATPGGDTVAVTPGWSPDGRRIIVSLRHQTTGQQDIYTAHSNGTNLVQATNNPDFEDFADWGSLARPANQ